MITGTVLNGVEGSDSFFTSLTVVKREGQVVAYDRYKIFRAVHACLINCGEPEDEADILAHQVAEAVERIIVARTPINTQIGIETIRDLVESQLMAQGLYEAAKQYILYREDRRKVREAAQKHITTELREKFREGNQYFRGQNPLLQQIQAFDKFSRFNYDLGRREIWPEFIS